jgi:hypothetical protein
MHEPAHEREHERRHGRSRECERDDARLERERVETGEFRRTDALQNADRPPRCDEAGRAAGERQ